MLARLCLLTTSIAIFGSPAVAQQNPNPARLCYDSLAKDARFAPIADKVALSGFAMEGMRAMTKSNERASPQERPVLAAWKSAREACHQQELPYFATRDVEIQSLAKEHFTAVQTLIAELQAGALTYGEFGKRRIQLYETLMSRIEKVRQSIIPSKPSPRPSGN